MTRSLPAPHLMAAVGLGGAVGGVLRWGCGELLPDGAGLATIFAINVTGSLLLALLPGLAVVRRRRVVAVALGPGLLGGFTTMSAAAEQTRALAGAGDPLLAATYLLGTLAACLFAVALAARLIGSTGGRGR